MAACRISAARPAIGRVVHFIARATIAIMGSTIESNSVVFATGDRIRTDTGEERRIVVVSFDGKSAFVQLDGSGPYSTIPIYPVTQLTRLAEVR